MEKFREESKIKEYVDSISPERFDEDFDPAVV